MTPTIISAFPLPRAVFPLGVPPVGVSAPRPPVFPGVLLAPLRSLGVLGKTADPRNEFCELIFVHVYEGRKRLRHVQPQVLGALDRGQLHRVQVFEDEVRVVVELEPDFQLHRVLEIALSELHLGNF